MLTQASFKMREVVVTGMGLISCIGNDLDTVSKNLKAGKSGIKLNQEYADMGCLLYTSPSPRDGT